MQYKKKKLQPAKKHIYVIKRNEVLTYQETNGEMYSQVAKEKNKVTRKNIE